MKLGMQVGLSPGHTVFDGVPALPLPKGAEPPIFGPYLLWPNGWMDQDVTWREAGLSPSDIVFDGDPAPSPKGDGALNFRPTSIMAKLLDGSKMALGTEAQRHCVSWGLSSPVKGARPPVFGQCLLWPRLDG